jgi:hypothetical protein
MTSARLPSERASWWFLLALAMAAVPAKAAINLEWRPVSQSVQTGDTVYLGLYAVSDSDADQLLAAADVYFSWDPAYMRLLALDDTGAVSLLFSGFPASDPCNTNEEVPPQDGGGYYLAWANLGSPVPATSSGTLLTTFEFEALAEITETEVVILDSVGPQCNTVVWDGTIPNTDVTGTLGSVAVTILGGQPTCVCGDIDGSAGFVDLNDFATFAICFGLSAPNPPGCDALAFVCSDMDANNQVDLNDFATFAVTYGLITTATVPNCLVK